MIRWKEARGDIIRRVSHFLFWPAFLLAFNLLHILSLQQPVYYLLCDRVFECDNATPAPGTKSCRYHSFMSSEGGDEGLSLLFILSLIKDDVAIYDGV